MKTNEYIQLKDLSQRKIHHEKKRFISPFNSPVRTLGEVMRWKIGRVSNEFRRNYKNERFNPIVIDWEKARKCPGLSITFITHASIMIKDGDDCIFVDPVFFGQPWPLKDYTPVRIYPPVTPGKDLVLVTHGHYDHLDIKSLRLFKDASQFIFPLGYTEQLRAIGAKNVLELDWFDTCTVRGKEITLLPCNHWTMRNPFRGPNTALWGSYIIKTATGPVIYIAGDTAYFDHFAEIGKEYAIDIAIFNVGAYEPRWFMQTSHMNPAETVKAFKELGAKKMLIVHWGSFRLGDEPVHFPYDAVREEMGKEGLLDRFIDIRHGETVAVE